MIAKSDVVVLLTATCIISIAFGNLIENAVNLPIYCEDSNHIEDTATVCTNLNFILGLDFFDPFLQLTTYNVTFMDSNIPILPSAIFKVFTMMRTFAARSCNISLVTKFSFKGANYLEKCDLSTNRLTELKDNSFMFATNLKQLDLSNNNIREIEKNAFVGLNRLETLYLNQNKMKMLSNTWLRHLPAIRNLEIRRNVIETPITSATFKFNAFLGELFLGYNNIRKISADAFDNRESLIVDLSANKLTEFQSESLLGLELEANPLDTLIINGFVQDLSIGNPELSVISILDTTQTVYLNFEESPFLNLSFIKPMKNLEALSIHLSSGSELNDDFFNNLSKLISLKLDLKNATGFSFMPLRILQNLKTLELTSTIFLDDNIRNDFPTLTNLQYLIMNDVDLIAAEAIKFRRTFPKLRELYIVNRTMECAYMEKVVQFLSQLTRRVESLQTSVNFVAIDKSVYEMQCVDIVRSYNENE